MVKNAGPHPAALGYAYDVETAVTLSMSCLVQTKALVLSDAFNALFLCVSHGGAQLIFEDLFEHRFIRPQYGCAQPNPDRTGTLSFVEPILLQLPRDEYPAHVLRTDSQGCIC
jgi:hypothetical protein